MSDFDREQPPYSLGEVDLSDLSQFGDNPDSETSLDSQELDPSISRLDRMITAAQIAVVGAEVTPLNETIRFGLAGMVQAMDGDPALVAATLAGATMAVEGGAAMASASLLDKPTGNRAVNWLNKKLKRNLDGDTEMGKYRTNLPLEAGVAYGGGSSVVMLMKQVQNPERSKSENRKYGMIVSAGLSVVLGFQGYLASKGIETADPKVIGGAVAAFGAPIAVSRYITNRANSKNNEPIEPEGPIS